MNLLAAKLYDPAVAVSKATTSAIAMTAIDTTNLRLAITVPAHGMVYFHLKGTLHGATTFPQIMLGVLNGATVVGRVAPMTGGGNLAATTQQAVEAFFVATGLTPGAMNVDAAYGVETVVASTGLKYGGPNNTSANDAFGGFTFEAWDPQPQTANSTLAVDASGRVDVGKVAGTTQTAGDIIADTNDIQARLPAALVSGRIDASVGAMAAGVVTAAAVATGAIDADALATDAVAEIADGVWDEAIAGHLTAGSTGAALNGAGAAGDPWSTSLPGAYGAGTAGKIIGDNLNAAVASRSSHSAADVWAVATRRLSDGTNIVLAKGTGVTGFNDLSAAQVNTECDTALADAGVTTTVTGRIDAAVSSRSTYAGADTAGTTTLLSRLTALRAAGLDNLDAAISATLAASDYVAPDNAGVAAIKAKTDSLNFTVAGKLDVNTLCVNGITVTGAGTAELPWGPA